MKRFTYLIMVLGLCCLTSIAHANGIDSLTLTPAEMQKLKKYFPTDDSTHLIWKGDVLSIQLPLNQEKRVVFSAHVMVDVKSALTTDQLRLLNDDKSVYFTALKAIPTTRIYVTTETGEVILIDIATSDSANNTTQYVDLKSTAPANQSAPTGTSSNIVTTTMTTSGAVDEDNNSVADASSTESSYVDKIRFAWMQMYAPNRLLKDAPHYTRAAMHTDRFVSDLVYGDKVIAHPESSWMIGNQYATVVSLQNKYPHRTSLDLRKDLCGDWLAATLYPRSLLKPQGNRSGDSTTLFLISAKPFAETIGVCHGDA